jgi:hypothetical protein
VGSVNLATEIGDEILHEIENELLMIRAYVLFSALLAGQAQYSKMIYVPGASAASDRNVPKIALVETYMVTPSHAKRRRGSVRAED